MLVFVEKFDFLTFSLIYFQIKERKSQAGIMMMMTQESVLPHHVSFFLKLFLASRAN